MLTDHVDPTTPQRRTLKSLPPIAELIPSYYRYVAAVVEVLKNAKTALKFFINRLNL